MSGHNERIEAEHRCSPPTLPTAPAVMSRPDWTCGICGRVWHHMNDLVQWWAEIRGPNG